MEWIADALIEAALHGVVAALIVELLIRRLPVLALGPRAQLRWFALTLPALSVPALHVLAPLRASPVFADVALFSSERWMHLAVAGWSAKTLAFTAFAFAGLSLLLRDAVRDAHHALRERHHPRHGATVTPWLEAVRILLADVCARAGERPPALVASDHPAPVLLTRGIRDSHIVVSRTLVHRLRPEGLEAALAHELSHVRHHDVRRGLALALLRTLQWFNPVAQVLARRITQETEWRADDEATALTGNGPALARALLETVRGRHGDFLGAFGHARIAALELRCRRVLRVTDEPLPGLSRPELAAITGIVSLLVFLVR